MKKIILFIFLMSSCNEKIINCEELVNVKRLVYYDGKLYNGKCKIIKGEILIEQRSYKKGMRSGKWVKYYENGQLEYEGYAENNELNGEFISFFDNGNINTKGEFDMGYQVGTWEYYDENGDLLEVKNFEKPEEIE